MINSAERSMAALAERDRLIALQRSRERNRTRDAEINFASNVSLGTRTPRRPPDSEEPDRVSASEGGDGEESSRSTSQEEGNDDDVAIP